MVGWHIEEKNILMIVIPLCLTCVDSFSQSQTFLLLVPAATISLFPLFPGLLETVIKITMTYIHNILIILVLHDETRKRMHSRRIAFSGFSSSVSSTHWYLEKMLTWSILFSIFSPLFLPSYEYLPQMVISVVVAFRNCFGWVRCWFDHMTIVKHAILQTHRKTISKHKKHLLFHVLLRHVPKQPFPQSDSESKQSNLVPPQQSNVSDLNQSSDGDSSSSSSSSIKDEAIFLDVPYQPILRFFGINF